MYCDPMEACDVYTRQCSTLLTTVELATIGATIAAKGRNPLTGEQVLKPENCACIMAEMTMEEKNAISHRGNALAVLEQQLPGFLAE